MESMVARPHMARSQFQIYTHAFVWLVLSFKKSVISRCLKTAWLIKQGGYKTNTGRLGERDLQYTKNWFVHHAYFLWQRQDDRLLRSAVSVSAGKHAVIRRVMPGQCCMPHCYTAHPWRLAAKSNKPEAGTQQPGRSWCFSLSRGKKKKKRGLRVKPNDMTVKEWNMTMSPCSPFSPAWP